MSASVLSQSLPLLGDGLSCRPGLLWMYLVSDIATGLAYLATPIGLSISVIQRRERLLDWTFWLVSLCIAGCGITCFIDVWVLWHPFYAVPGMLKASTAAAAVLTATLLWKALLKAADSPTVAHFRQLSEQLASETMRHENTVEQLRRTEESFQLLIESVHDCAMFTVDLSGRVISWNAGAQHIKQYQAAEIIGQHFARFYTAAEQAAGIPMRALATAATEGRHQEEGWRVRKDGTLFLADVLINPILDRAGNLAGFAKITDDITRRKATEKDLELARAALAQAQKMEAVGQLTGGIAHDFNNMLTAILGSLELLEIRRETFSVDAGGLLQVIRHAADHGAELTRRLLTFSRKQALAPVRTNLNRLVSGMSELLRRTIGNSIDVETILTGSLWPVWVDPNQVESALLNLSVNARDAMANGGKLTIETGNVFLDAAYVRRHGEGNPGDYSFVAVSDTGCGMTADVKQHAFEPFYTTKALGIGTGLGLSQVYGFVRQSDGHVEIHSEIGRGTTVKIYFPHAEVEQELLEPLPLEAGAFPQGTETILIVDDDRNVLTYSVNAARHLGFHVLEATSAADALTIIEAHPDVQLLFIDDGLPGMNGCELADSVTAVRPNLKLVFTSGYARTAIAPPPGLLERGVVFLPKPFRIGSLARVLRSALDAA